jgi:hypothetical protein
MLPAFTFLLTEIQIIPIINRIEYCGISFSMKQCILICMIKMFKFFDKKSRFND